MLRRIDDNKLLSRQGDVEVNTLYLFGNGFDIAHGIRTPYSAFRSFLETQHEEFLYRFGIESVKDLPKLDESKIPKFEKEVEQ